MLPVPREVYAEFEKAMAAAKVAPGERGSYLKWLRYYWDFAGKYGHSVDAAETLPQFLSKLASKGQSAAQRAQASQAVKLYQGLRQEAGTAAAPQAAIEETPAPYPDRAAEFSGSRSEPERRAAGGRAADGPPPSRSDADFAGLWAKELASLSNAVQVRNYSPKTLQAYLHWTRKFCAFTGGKAAASLSTADVEGFLTELAVRQHVAASTQNQAFNALLFFYRHVLGREFGKVDGVVRAKRRRYIPVVLSRREIDLVLAQLSVPDDLIVKLLYGCGLRISECLDLRIHCLNLDARILTVHDGKGQKDRTVPLPETILAELEVRLGVLRELHERDLAVGYAGVFLPKQLDKKYRNAAREFIWQWLFPAPQLTLVRGTAGERRRWHLQASHVNQAVKTAAHAAALTKRVTPHTFRHSFASHLLQANYDLVTIQKLLGHSDVKTTMIYTQTVPSQTLKEARSPLDFPEDQRAPGDSGGS